MRYFLKVVPALSCWGGFIFVIIKVPYPDSLTQANFTQLTPFIFFLFSALSLTLNIFLRNIFISGSVSLGLIFILILKALDSFNFVTGSLVAVVMYLLVSYFGKTRRKNLTPIQSGLTKLPKIPTLTRFRKQKG